ncbi:MAG: ABC transporter ATP-binding protein [Candidatus Dormibacteria bacterium]
MTEAAAVAVAPRGVSIHCDAVVHLYPNPGGDVVALRGVDLDVEAGGAIALLGPSGSGKSTLLALLAGLLRPSSGHVLIGSHDLVRISNRALLQLRSTEISLMLQDPMRNLLGFGTAEQNIEFAQREARRRRGHAPPWSPVELLGLLGMESLARQTVGLLSGGEQQRVAIAAAAAAAPALLLLDEPTSELDVANRDLVLELVLRVHEQLGTTLVVVTHDPAVAAAMPRTVSIRDGRIGAEGRSGQEYAVVGRDGSVQLPQDVLEWIPAGTLLRVRRHSVGVDLRNPELEPDGE